MTVTNTGLNILMDRLVGGGTYAKPSKFKVGIGDTASSETDTDLENPVPLTNTEQVDNCDATTGWTDSADMTITLNTTTEIYYELT